VWRLSGGKGCDSGNATLAAFTANKINTVTGSKQGGAGSKEVGTGGTMGGSGPVKHRYKKGGEGNLKAVTDLFLVTGVWTAQGNLRTSPSLNQWGTRRGSRAINPGHSFKSE